METRASASTAGAASDPATTVAHDLPGLYRVILDRVAQLESIGSRNEAGRIRVLATAAYSGAWNEAGRHRLVGLIGRADRVIADNANPRAWALRRRPARG
jgi:hypothetical protein